MPTVTWNPSPSTPSSSTTTRRRGFEHLTENEFIELRGLPNPDDEVLGLLTHRIYDIAMCYAYTAVETPSQGAVNLVSDVVGRLGKHGIQLPDSELVRGFPFSEFYGWGIQVRPEGLSGEI